MKIVEQKYNIEKLNNTNKILPFFKPYGDGIGPHVLCQWYNKSWFEDGFNAYNCMEQYMMYQKAILMNHPDNIDIGIKILYEDDPAKIRKYGRDVKNFDNKLWDRYKFSIVYQGNYLKFSQNKRLRDYLIETYDAILVEASPYDDIWGVKLSENDNKINDPKQWNGQNLLGFALMQVRDKLRGEY